MDCGGPQCPSCSSADTSLLGMSLSGVNGEVYLVVIVVVGAVVTGSVAWVWRSHRGRGATSESADSKSNSDGIGMKRRSLMWLWQQRRRTVSDDVVAVVPGPGGTTTTGTRKQRSESSTRRSSESASRRSSAVQPEEAPGGPGGDGSAGGVDPRPRVRSASVQLVQPQAVQPLQSALRGSKVVEQVGLRSSSLFI